MKILSPNNPLPNRPAHALTHQVFTVMLGLGRRIDSAKPTADSLVDKIGRALFLPGCPVDEDGKVGRDRRGRGAGHGSEGVSLEG